MRVDCTFFGPLREPVGEKTVVRELPEGATVADLVDRLVEEFDGLAPHLVAEDGGVPANSNVTIDGRNVRQLDGMDSRLEDGATVRFATSVVGG